MNTQMKHLITITGIAAMVVFGSALPAAAQVDPPLADLMLIDFEGSFNLSQLTVETGTAAVINDGGNNVLQLTAAAGQTVKVRLTKASGNWNLLDYVNLTMDIENTGGDEAWVRILIKDGTVSSDSFYLESNLSCSHNAWVQPAETRIFNAMMPRHKYRGSIQVPVYKDLFPKMNGLPHAQPLVWYGVDVTRVNEVVLQLEPQDYAQTVQIDNLRGNRRAKPLSLEADPTTNSVFFPFIDAYGQYMHEDWTDKIMTDTDLTNATTAEDADLAANPRPAVFNAYGGWVDGPTLPATGHFRTEKVDDKWWLVDPVGKLFWMLGCNSVGLSEGHTTLDGKEHFYAALPDQAQYPEYFDIPNNYFKSFYPPLEIKYGANFESTYQERTLERIQSWGLNTLGAWSDASNNQPAALKTPYTKIIWTPGVPIPTMSKLDDPFDANFRNAVVTAISWTGNAKDDPYCIGFFDHNEIEWGNDAEQEARDIMEQISSSLALKVEMVNFLQARHGTIGAANAAWGSSYSSFNDLLPAQGSGNFNWSGAAADMRAFYAHLADTYYSEFRAAMKSVAPNKLYLGSRIKGSTMLKEVASAAAAHCDAVSFNIYQKDLYEFQGVTAENEPFFPEDKPFFVGEFNFGALDRGMFWTGIEYAADQRNRGEAYRHFINSGLEDPRCVGAHWFAYKDGPLASRASDSENAAMGLLDSVDTPHSEMIAALRQTATEMYAYRYGDTTPPEPPEVSALLANWQFNEPAGAISTAINSAGFAAWADENDWTLNGNGQAEVTGTVTERNAAPFASVSSGSVFMRIDYEGWNFDGDRQIRAGFELDNQELYVRLRGRSNNPYFGVGNNNDQSVDAVSGNGMSIILGVDLDADTYSLWWDDGRTGTYAPLSTDVSITASSSFDAPYFRNTQFTGSNPVGIDMLLYGTNYSDVANYGPSPYEIWSAAYGLTGVDDDLDGMDNFTEFAMGGNPTNPSMNGHVPVFLSQGSNFHFVYPSRKDAGLLYWLETSTNLVSGSWTNTGYTVLPDTGAYDADFDAVTNEIPVTEDNTFIRLQTKEL